jgi:hypothetical protein
MQISQEELQRRLNSGKNLVNKLARVSVPQQNPESQSRAQQNEGHTTENRGNDENNRNNCGRKEDIPNAPESLRLVAGLLSKAEGNAARVARNLEINSGQARYAEKKVNKLTEIQVQELALTRLMDTLGILTVDKIEDEKPKDIASIGANLSRIYSNLKPKDAGAGAGVNITIYSPSLKKLDEFETIEVRTA